MYFLKRRRSLAVSLYLTCASPTSLPNVSRKNGSPFRTNNSASKLSQSIISNPILCKLSKAWVAQVHLPFLKPVSVSISSHVKFFFGRKCFNAIRRHAWKQWRLSFLLPKNGTEDFCNVL